MLHDPARHEPLIEVAWDAAAAARSIERIVRDTEARFSPDAHWPMHPLDADGRSRAPALDVYWGAGGVVWGLEYLRAVGAVSLRRAYGDYVDTLPPLNRADAGPSNVASYLGGDTGLELLSFWLRPAAATAARLEALIAGNLEHLSRELMLGAPGTMLAALFLHRRTGEPRWARLYLRSARALWSQLEWSAECACAYWPQMLFGHRSAYLGGVHGFAATAAVIIAGRDLLPSDEWDQWREVIVTTIRNTATREDGGANWRPDLDTRPQKRLLQFCHGAPGIVVCVAGLADERLDDVLSAGGEAIWMAGPLVKGANLCHGTGGNGYAFLALFARTGDAKWLTRARAFAMHGIAQTDAHAQRYGQMRYSLWTGDVGFAIFLRDCLRGAATFPTLDTFFAG